MSTEIKEIYDQLIHLQRLLRRWHHHEAENSPFASLTSGQGRVIRLLQMQPAVATRDLSYLLDIRQQSLNELLTKLEKNGYVERRPSEEDKRVMIVHLTDKGREVTQHSPACEDLFVTFSEEELGQFSSYIDRIASVLEEKTKDYHPDMMHHHFHEGGPCHRRMPHPEGDTPEHHHHRHHRMPGEEGMHHPHGRHPRRRLHDDDAEEILAAAAVDDKQSF